MEDHNESQIEEGTEGITLGEEVQEEPQVDPTGQVVGLGEGQYHWGTGRRKCSVARVRVRPGKGEMVLNDRSLEDFFPRILDRNAVLSPLRDLGVDSKIDVMATVEGGGLTGQAGAVRLGIARALLVMYPDALVALRSGKHLTRDPRMVERKKYGLRGARRAFQWVKR
ncbi:MAG TPA: 30S ribosomal protein S9 [Planctomycetota bacterium]|jgi:small subunit ribosomal protein S9|nr:30S ribosomal protein S9 [Planctomycetota bacterium]HJM38590.1 30S ribosomal protein S9 [Planctomycetota bacterium]|tara:strand:+ start:13211 stop:13714 length:504 start_codon:yes stop_codon:yes gene_type:complete